MDIAEFQRLRRTGATTALEQTRECLTRIARHDPALHAVLCLSPEAESRARASDARARAGALLGRLDGVTVLVKDNIDTADLPTTAGSRALAESRPARDASVVARLHAAGAVVLGKTNLSEWANFRSTRSVDGWSAVGGQTANPHLLAHDPGGSSSGSAAAVAAGMAQLALGTETNGSIVSPAGLCGVVGLKPTGGLIPTGGVVPISPHQDTVGVLARHVDDAATALAVLSRTQRDRVAGPERPDLGPAWLRGRRIGVWRRPGSRFADRVLDGVLSVLADAGAVCVDVEVPDLAEIDELSWLAVVAEFRGALDEYLRTRPDGPACLTELVEFNRVDPIELSRFGQDIFELAVDADPLDRDHRPTATRLARAAIENTVAAHRLDAIAAPTNGPAMPIGNPGSPVDSATPAAVARYPAITVPAGSAGPLPMGITFLSGAHQDALVLDMAAAFERLAQARREPDFHPVLPT